MAPQHEARERHGSRLPTEWTEPAPERGPSQRMMDDLEMEQPPRPRALTWPAVKEAIYVGGGVLGIVLSGCATYYGVVGEVRDIRGDIVTLRDRVVLIEHSRAEVMPKFEDSLRNNAIQDQRLQNLTEANARTAVSVNDLARAVSVVTDKLGDMRERQAILEERLGHAVPHDR